MHVNAKKTAVSGLLMALSVVLIVLSGILDFSTLFFLAAAAFFVGIIIKEYGLGYGTAFFLGCTVLGFLLAPQKLYVLTYVMMSLYVLGIEFLWRWLGKHPDWNHRKGIFTAGKFLIFNVSSGAVFVSKTLICRRDSQNNDSGLFAGRPGGAVSL